MALLKVHTAQNVQLNYTIGNIGQRILGAVLDVVVVIAYLYIIQFSLSIIASVEIFQDDLDIIFYLILVLPPLLYLPLSEYFWKGQTVGKRIMKLKVIRVDGSTPSLGDIILRWLLRTIDIKLGFLFIFFIPKSPSSDAEQLFIIWAVIFLLIPFPLVGILSMAFTPHCQRLGDLAANTTVIINKRPYSLDDTILQLTQEDYQPKFLNVLQLRDKDIYIIKNALEHAKKNHDYKTLGDLGQKAKELLDIKEDIKPLQLLETIVRDYNHLARKRDLG